MEKIYRTLLSLVNQLFTFKMVILSVLFVFIGCSLNANQNHYKTDINVKKLEIGDTIPNIILKDQNGELFNLKAETKSKNVVLYFYPKDNTAGCTAQACSFRDQITDFTSIDAVVIGISGQSVESHKKFAEEYKLPFTLLSDEGNKIREKLGVPSNLFGLLPGRVTYVIDKTGKVVDIINSQANIKAHISESLKTLKKSDLI